jgi:hypothetical protein
MRNAQSYAPKSAIAVTKQIASLLLILTLNSCGGNSPSEPTTECQVAFGSGESQFLKVINRTSSRINIDFFRSPAFVNFQSELRAGECALHGLPVNFYNILIQRLPNGAVIHRGFMLDRNETETITLTNDDF